MRCPITTLTNFSKILSFSGNDYFISVDTSDVKEGLVVGQVHAEDRDQGVNGQVKYFLKNPGNTQVTMKITPIP